MKTPLSRKSKKRGKAYHVAVVGRAKVPVYRRLMPNGAPGFMVVNYAGGKRRFDSFVDEADAMEAAAKLARQLSERDVLGASMTREQSLEYAAAVQTLQPYNISLTACAGALAECLKQVRDVPNLHAAVKFYLSRHKLTTAKRVSEVVTELLKVKAARHASERYLQDLRFRLGKFAEAFQKDACNVTTPEIQEWLDGQKLAPQSYANFRRVVYLLFEFAVARGYAADNPVEAAERVKVRAGDIEIFKPSEIARLLAAAPSAFVPCIAIGAFAGLRSAEVERLDWSDIDLVARHIVVGASRAKTASRRIVPIHDNLAAWLADYKDRKGLVWTGTHEEFYEAQQEAASATAVAPDHEKGIKAQEPIKWKSNGLRHSYASYRFAQIGDAGRVAGELGNSAAVVHRHYRELVKSVDATAWFNVRPEAPLNILQLSRSSQSAVVAAASA